MDGMVVGHEVGGWGDVLLEDLLPIQAYPKRLSRAGGKGIIRRMTHAQPLRMHRVTVDEAATFRFGTQDEDDRVMLTRV